MSEDDVDDDSIDIELRSSDVVARRCIILAAILQRFLVDTSPQDDPMEAAFDLREWLRTESLWAEATPGEQAFFAHPQGHPEPRGSLDVALVAESLAAVAWALDLLPSLSDDHPTELASLILELPSPWESTSSWSLKQTLRPESEIAKMRELHEVWNWRLEVELERRSSKGQDLIELDDLIRTVTHDAIAADLLAPGHSGGFTLDGVPVTAMPPDKIAEQQFLTQQRLTALNWICGFGDDWDNVPIDV
jgi:hypothetical protein